VGYAVADVTDHIWDSVVAVDSMTDKNFLFRNTPAGAKTSAIVFSIVETAKGNGLKPFDYIEYLLSALPNTDLAHLDPFMPWPEELPDHCRTPKKKIELRLHDLHLRMRVFLCFGENHYRFKECLLLHLQPKNSPSAYSIQQQAI